MLRTCRAAGHRRPLTTEGHHAGKAWKDKLIPEEAMEATMKALEKTEKARVGQKTPG